MLDLTDLEVFLLLSNQKLTPIEFQFGRSHVTIVLIWLHIKTLITKQVVLAV